MKKLAVIFVIGMILLMTVGIVFAEGRDSMKKIDFSDLPPEINITNVGDTNLVIYEINVDGEKIFAITYSEEQSSALRELIISHDTRQFLNFGFAGEMSESGFLKTSTGVEGDLEKGYVMMRKGSITGISTNLDVIKGDDSGQIEIIIYKNGEPIGFGNILNAVSSGMKKDYDLQSKDTVIFESGDIISVKVNFQENIIWKDVTTMIEITTLD